jgi:hypothetical protein
MKLSMALVFSSYLLDNILSGGPGRSLYLYCRGCGASSCLFKFSVSCCVYLRPLSLHPASIQYIESEHHGIFSEPKFASIHSASIIALTKSHIRKTVSQDATDSLPIHSRRLSIRGAAKFAVIQASHPRIWPRRRLYPM